MQRKSFLLFFVLFSFEAEVSVYFSKTLKIFHTLVDAGVLELLLQKFCYQFARSRKQYIHCLKMLDGSCFLGFVIQTKQVCLGKCWLKEHYRESPQSIYIFILSVQDILVTNMSVGCCPTAKQFPLLISMLPVAVWVDGLPYFAKDIVIIVTLFGCHSYANSLKCPILTAL